MRLLLEELTFESNTGPSVAMEFLPNHANLFHLLVHIEFQNVTSVANNAEGLKDFSLFLSLDDTYTEVSIVINDSQFQGTDNITTGIHTNCTEFSPVDKSTVTLNVTNSVFSGYRNSSLIMYITRHYRATVGLENVTFTGSSSYKACAPALATAVINSKLYLKNVTFHKNRVKQPTMMKE